MQKRIFAISALAFTFTLLLAGCTSLEQQREQTPTFIPFTLPTPTPRTSTITPSPSPTPTVEVSKMPVERCANEGECLDEKPKYCEKGLVVNNCGKCGCPNGTQCCRTSALSGFYCAAPSLCIENWTGMGSGGTLVVISPTPTPSPSPGAVPCKTALERGIPTPNLTSFFSLVSDAYKSIFNKSISWTQADAHTFVFTDSGADYKSELWFYVGLYSGWQPLDVLKEVTNDSRADVDESLKCWRKIAVNNENSPRQDPHYYWFKMPCFNWTYMIDARITERIYADVAWAHNYSKRFAQNLINVCLE